METFGKRLRTLRARANLSQKALGRLARVANGTIVSAEKSSEKSLNTGTYEAITAALAKRLKMSIEEVDAYLVGPLPPPTPPAESFPIKKAYPPSDAARLDEALARMREIEKHGASADYLREIGGGPVEPGTRVRPIHGGDDIAAGEPVQSASDFDPGDAHQFLPGELFPWDDLAFFVRVRGNSMYPAFEDGDVVIGSPALRDQVESGDCVCVRFTKESRFRGGLTIKRITQLDAQTVRLESLNPSEKHVGEVRMSEIDEIGPCVMHIRQLWKRNGYSVGELHKAHRVKTADPKSRSEEEQRFPDYDAGEGAAREE